jgi:predicted outer membrane protein
LDAVKEKKKMQLNRRHAILGLALTGATPLLVAGAARAQGTPVEASGETEYIQQTLATGTIALRSSEVAVEKATDPLVKAFAQLEVAEQTTIATVLSSTEAGKQPAEMLAEDAEKIEALEGTEAGATFDEAYVDMQIEGHQKLLEIQKTLSGGTEPTVEVITAKLAEQAVMSHLAVLDHIKQHLGESA